MSSMKDFKIYDSYQISQLQGIYIPSLSASFLALLIQFTIACTLVFYGCKKRKFN